MERFIKTVIGAAAKKQGAQVTITIRKEGDCIGKPISAPTGRADGDGGKKPSSVLP